MHIFTYNYTNFIFNAIVHYFPWGWKVFVLIKNSTQHKAQEPLKFFIKTLHNYISPIIQRLLNNYLVTYICASYYHVMQTMVHYLNEFGTNNHQCIFIAICHLDYCELKLSSYSSGEVIVLSSGVNRNKVQCDFFA